MRRAALVCLALAMAVTGSPIAAQQTTPDQPTQPVAPQPASELPPPMPQSSTEPPPPFPHYPARAPREHDPNYRKSTHAHRRSASSHHAKTHHRASKHHRATTHHGAATQRHAATKHFSKRTIRQCHRMTYKQIMGHKYCRMMMDQDLETAKKRKQRAHHSTKHRRTAHRHKAHHYRG
jgi:hypothetical protein